MEGGAMSETTWVEEAKKNSGLLIFLGVLTVIFGLIAVAMPLITGVAVSVYVGVLVAVAGVFRIVHAMKSRQWGVGVWGTVVGLLMVFAGILLFARPVFGLATLTMLLAIYLAVEGVTEILVAFKMRPDAGWGWMLFGGIVALVLGFMIWRQWPLSGAWAIGTLFGIHILITGWEMIILGSGARTVAGALGAAADETMGVAGDAVEKAQDLAEDAVDAAGDAIDKAQDLAGDAVDKAKDVAEDAVDAAGDMVDKAKDFAGDMADKAEDVVDGAVDKAKDVIDREDKA
jgi:uncharacterized membrane protein HdeD (DUF308 family)